MHKYRTHNCGALRASDAGKEVRISGWIHRKRDHGGLLFIDLRDHFGITQCVINLDSDLFTDIEKFRLENVISVTGEVLKRTSDTVNKNMLTGEIELKIKSFELLSSEVTDM